MVDFVGLLRKILIIKFSKKICFYDGFVPTFMILGEFWKKKTVKFSPCKGPPYDFRVKNHPLPNQKFFSKIKMYGNIMQNAAFKIAEI